MPIGKYIIHMDDDRTFYLLDNDKKINLGYYRETYFIKSHTELLFFVQIYRNYICVVFAEENDKNHPSIYFKNFGFYENEFKNLDWLWEKAAKLEDWENYFLDYPEDYEDGVEGWMDSQIAYNTTMLFQTENENEYIFIGTEIYKFKTQSKILGFVSTIDPDYLQHPYAYNDDHYYLLLDKIQVDNIFDHCKHDPYEIIERKNLYIKTNRKKMEIIQIVETDFDLNYFVRSQL